MRARTTTCSRAIDDLLPAEDRWRHRHGSKGHGRDHVLPAWIPPYATLPVIDGRIALGTWQSICLVDPNGDNPTRQVRFSFLSDGVEVSTPVVRSYPVSTVSRSLDGRSA